ncbi:MAG TPA: hypothetical protein VFQ66_02775 [Candidatus Limnocylindria bacterium]|nr:hypothetical protein [Candidatus Limnocylindria bacterium]
MNLATRILATSVALGLVAAACGGGTGEAPSTAVVTAAPVTQATAAPVAAKPTALMLVVDTVRGTQGVTDDEKKADNPASLVCVVMSKFPQGSRIVWRAVVSDPLTNKPLDDKALESVKLTLADGKTADLKYGPHGGTKENPAQFFWVAGWTVPADYPTGAFAFKIEAKSKEGVIGTYGHDYFKVPAAQLQIVPPGTRRL